MNKKHIHTNFIKFILEKYNKEIQELPEEETIEPKKKIKEIDEFDEIVNNDEEVQGEEETQDDDENVDELLKEYKALEKKYWRKRNDTILKRR
ncbi:MAG: hypothetical protein ABI441_15080 [Flavobacterium sp.]